MQKKKKIKPLQVKGSSEVIIKASVPGNPKFNPKGKKQKPKEDEKNEKALPI